MNSVATSTSVPPPAGVSSTRTAARSSFGGGHPARLVGPAAADQRRPAGSPVVRRRGCRRLDHRPTTRRRRGPRRASSAMIRLLTSAKSPGTARRVSTGVAQAAGRKATAVKRDRIGNAPPRTNSRKPAVEPVWRDRRTVPKAGGLSVHGCLGVPSALGLLRAEQGIAASGRAGPRGHARGAAARRRRGVGAGPGRQGAAVTRGRPR